MSSDLDPREQANPVQIDDGVGWHGEYLAPDKDEIFRELNRVLKPGGRLQVADILVDKPIPDSAKANIDLWTG